MKSHDRRAVSGHARVPGWTASRSPWWNLAFYHTVQFSDRVLPLHEVIPVDHYLPGCPPPADRIKVLLEQLLKVQRWSIPARLPASVHSWWFPRREVVGATG